MIEKQVSSFRIPADSNTTVTTDLNSEAWIDRESVEARAVSSSEIQSATTVTVN